MGKELPLPSLELAPCEGGGERFEVLAIVRRGKLVHGLAGPAGDDGRRRPGATAELLQEADEALLARPREDVVQGAERMGPYLIQEQVQQSDGQPGGTLPGHERDERGHGPGAQTRRRAGQGTAEGLAGAARVSPAGRFLILEGIGASANPCMHGPCVYSWPEKTVAL